MEIAHPPDSGLLSLLILNSMADSSTTAQLILDLLLGRRWARRQLHGGIKNVPVASILMKSLSTPWGGVLGRLSGDAGDPRARWQIPPQLLNRSWNCHLDIAGLDASFTPV